MQPHRPHRLDIAKILYSENTLVAFLLQKCYIFVTNQPGMCKCANRRHYNVQQTTPEGGYLYFTVSASLTLTT